MWYKSPCWETFLSQKGHNGARHRHYHTGVLTGPLVLEGEEQLSEAPLTPPTPEACESEAPTCASYTHFSFSNSKKAA